MASGGTVEIQVQLQGAGKVQQRLHQLGQGATVAGDKFTAAGSSLAASSNLMASSIGGVVGSVGALSTGIGALTTATQTAGASFLSVAGPIIAVGAAIGGVVMAVKRYIDQTSDLQTMLDAQKAAYTDFTSLLERFTDQNVTLTEEETRRFKSLIRLGKAELEYIQRIEEGEGVAGQRLLRYRQEEARARQAIQIIRDRGYSEAAFLELTRNERQRLARATEALHRAERTLDERRMRALAPLREVANLEEQIMESRGRSALQRQAEAAQKAQAEAAQSLRNIQNLQLRLSAETLQASGASLANRVSLLQVELAERRRVINETVTDEQEKLTALAAAEQAFVAKRRALYRADSQQRQARRAQEAAAAEAAELARFQDEQRLAEARIRLNTEGFEQQRQLIELRFQTAQRMAQNELQTETALLNKRRELMELEQRQEAERRRAEMQRIEALQRALELTRQEAMALQELASVDMTKITGAVESFGQGLVYASLAALQSGESVSIAVGEALKAIALQAGVEAIMETARGTAALFTNPIEAGAHFKAAAFFGAAAVAAGSAGAALGSGGGGGGGGGASPTGTAQSVRDFDRDEQQERGAVTINVNMGQATIYDTKAAAERAFADRVVSAINSPRRGAVRLRRS